MLGSRLLRGKQLWRVTRLQRRCTSTTTLGHPHGEPLAVEKPTNQQLKIFAIANAVPMIGFGLMDNLVMIQAGDLIDSTIGVTLVLSTLTAAAFGQVVSDMSGVAFGGAVEAFCNKLGLPTPDLTPQQLQQRSVRLLATGSRMVGVLIGCLTGMLSLLFMDLDKANRSRRNRELDTVFTTVVTQGRKLMHAENCRLFLLDEDGRHVYSRAVKMKKDPNLDGLRQAFEAYDTDRSGSITVMEMAEALPKLGYENIPPRFARALIEECTTGEEIDFPAFVTFVTEVLPQREVRLSLSPFMEEVLATGEIVNITDLHQDKRFDKEVDLYTGSRSHSLLLGPVKQSGGKIVGFVQLMNKKGDTGFTREDEVLLDMICSHVCVFIEEFDKKN